MIKKIFLIIVSLNLLNHCEYKPVYSNQNNVDYKIIITSFDGDKFINNLVASNLKRNSKNQSNEFIDVSFNTKYTKNVLAKNSIGTITDYQSNVIATFMLKKGENIERFVVNEKFNFQKMTDKYEERNYERTIKKNIATSISQKLILRLALMK